ncbi:P-loop containing nucleoside triphosphate hydrolase protein [Rozella allomycis CSF55]|uniref:P-loop containing nucleoside triphosphate hydrolase protein n=1 Tax=Rozella allomycis (strain CSF55) TaxID=988480 RepID=A0A4P9YF74_ROZAC|nr:P-loop containing nucleoside triphosphate hydrolase protein [Rozella allomycis CSF55]
MTKTTQRLRILSLGDPMVGKSSLIKRYCEENFSPEYHPTIGIDYGVKDFSIDEFKADFFDTAGDDVYLEIRNEFYENINAFIIVFDLTSKKSFENVNKWMSELKRYNQTSHIKALGFLFGNKLDLGRAISKTVIEQFASESNLS